MIQRQFIVYFDRSGLAGSTTDEARAMMEVNARHLLDVFLVPFQGVVTELEIVPVGWVNNMDLWRDRLTVAVSFADQALSDLFNIGEEEDPDARN